MIDLSKYTSYTVKEDGSIVNKRGRVLPDSKYIRLVDDLGVKHLVTKNRLVYFRLYGRIPEGFIITGEFPALELSQRSPLKDWNSALSQALFRRFKSGKLPLSTISRELNISLRTVKRMFKEWQGQQKIHKG